MNKMLTAYGAVAMLAISAAEAYAGPSMVTSWKETNLPLKACKINAWSALEAAGFSNISIPMHSAFGHLNAYSASVRCIESRSLVFFVVSGPDSTQCRSLSDKIKDNLQAE